MLFLFRSCWLLPSTANAKNSLSAWSIHRTKIMCYTPENERLEPKDQPFFAQEHHLNQTITDLCSSRQFSAV